MSTKTLLPSSSSHITDRYLFRSQSNDKHTSTRTRQNKSNHSPSLSKKRYRFSSTDTSQHNNKNVYKFPNKQSERRSHSSDSSRYYFSPDNTYITPQQTLTFARSGSGLEQRSVTLIDGTSTITSDTPYLFSKTTESQRYPSRTSRFIIPDGMINMLRGVFTIYFI
jgi:hypothetical protein